MKVLVTGGTGDVGRATVTRLVSHGHYVRVIGRTEGVAIDGAEYWACDINDFDRLREHIRGMQAVVHLAAIRHPSLAPGQEIFRVNCAGTYNVYRLEFVSRCRHDTERLLALPPERQRLRVDEIIERTEWLRAERYWEHPLTGYGMQLPDAPLIFGRSNFSTSIDARDSARAIEQGLLGEYEGSHAVYINDTHTCVGIEGKALARLFFPDVKQHKKRLVGTGALVSVEAARKLIGFEPEHSIAGP